VWLNADSKLEFPSNFVNSKTRFVKLSGEGYFEVSKDKAHPFIVQTDKQEVEVLGTHFNVNSYGDESSVRTTLLEGSVRINDATILKPGQQSVLIDNNRIAVKHFREEKSPDFYSNSLAHITRTLNNITHQERAKTVFMIIQDRILTEAQSVKRNYILLQILSFSLWRFLVQNLSLQKIATIK